MHRVKRSDKLVLVRNLRPTGYTKRACVCVCVRACVVIVDETEDLVCARQVLHQPLNHMTTLKTGCFELGCQVSSPEYTRLAFVSKASSIGCGCASILFKHVSLYSVFYTKYISFHYFLLYKLRVCYFYCNETLMYLWISFMDRFSTDTKQWIGISNSLRLEVS